MSPYCLLGTHSSQMEHLSVLLAPANFSLSLFTGTLTLSPHHDQLCSTFLHCEASPPEHGSTPSSDLPRAPATPLRHHQNHNFTKVYLLQPCSAHPDRNGGFLNVSPDGSSSQHSAMCQLSDTALPISFCGSSKGKSLFPSK